MDYQNVQTKARYKSPFLTHQLFMFSAPANNRVYKIVRFQFRGGLTNNEHIRVYPSLGPSLEVIALRPAG
jgi:hypothetical protein